MGPVGWTVTVLVGAAVVAGPASAVNLAETGMVGGASAAGAVVGSAPEAVTAFNKAKNASGGTLQGGTLNQNKLDRDCVRQIGQSKKSWAAEQKRANCGR